MPLGTPEGPSRSQWTAIASSVDRVGEYPVIFDVTATTDNPDAPGVAEIVQQFVDLITSSPDFQLLSATRLYSYSEPITPTA
ncbi:hypothetical protein OHB41_33950 [Streptomyces sp. NBC_01571]|uniref:hypothetical protein n=1 Tax=Streptomyces sp. NBC_01571 TaxID=2975883 RepID=UPI0022559055|nr:hypothetical protein [Streptomyces sp. NBC_01571]MCX4578106.1 hypothetical protein [Streptomyces sp. NBC_01571]